MGEALFVMSLEQYDAWYDTPRGHWIASREFALLLGLIAVSPRATLLDVGTGTGHFARRFAKAGLQVTGLDPESAALAYARKKAGDIPLVQGDAQDLPFADACFDYCAAVTSLCFMADPAAAVAEMWRVARRGIILGLLHRHSLLYRQKAGRGAYRGARWDDMAQVRTWLARILPAPTAIHARYALFLPDGGRVARALEVALPASMPYGAFLAVVLQRPPLSLKEASTL